MNEKERAEFDEIFNNLKAGGCYGYIFDRGVRFPYFQNVLYMTTCGNFGWIHYGSSANKPTKEGLEFILSKIFEMTPREFLENYRLQDDDRDNKEIKEIMKARGAAL